MNYAALIAPAAFAFAVVPSDTDLIRATSLYVGGAGDVALQTEGGDNVIFEGVPAGSLLPVRAARVLATGTTATAIVALSDR